MKNTLIKIKNFVERNATVLVVTGVTVTATAVSLIALKTDGIKSLNAFLDEKGLFEEYYGFEK